jgi:hypothetical protein
VRVKFWRTSRPGKPRPGAACSCSARARPIRRTTLTPSTTWSRGHPRQSLGQVRTGQEEVHARLVTLLDGLDVAAFMPACAPHQGVTTLTRHSREIVKQVRPRLAPHMVNDCGCVFKAAIGYYRST